jgi:hypothetical protein
VNEVAGKIVEFYCTELERVGVRGDRLLEGLPLDRAKLPGRIDWDLFCTLTDRLGQFVGGDEGLAKVGMGLFDFGEFEAPQRVFRMVASPQSLYVASQRWGGRRMFTNVDATIEIVHEGRLTMTLSYPDRYRACPGFFWVNVGVYRSLPKMLGLPNSLVRATVGPREASFDVMVPPSVSIWYRLRKAFLTVFAPGRAFEGVSLSTFHELGFQQERLHEQLNELEVARERDLERALDLDFLHRVGSAAASGLDLAEMLAQVVCEVSLEAEDSLCAAFAPDEEGRWRRVAHRGDLGQLPALERLADIKLQEDGVGVCDGCQVCIVSVRGEPLVMLVMSETVAIPARIRETLLAQIVVGVDNARSYGEVSKLRDELEMRVAERTEQLHSAQAQLVQSAKLASIGELAAHVAHEINNPLNALVIFVDLMQEDVDELELDSFPALAEWPGYLDKVSIGAQQCRVIVQKLLAFSRQSSDLREPCD